jgi:hypothetical protein
MPDGLDFDFSEMTRHAASFAAAPRESGPFLRSAVMRTSGNVKKEAAQSVGRSIMWGAAAAAIGYDLVAEPGEALSTLTSHIGYDKDKRGGALGNLREFGAPDATYGGQSVPLAPHNDLLHAMEDNVEDFKRGIIRALDDAEKAAGL